MRFLIPGLLLLLTACASSSETATGCSKEEVKKIKELAFKAETSFGALSGLLECGEFSQAFLLLSRPARQEIAEEEFILAMTNFDEMRRMLSEAEVHHLEYSGSTGIARVCNPEFRFSEDFQMLKEFGKIWTFDLNSDQIQKLTDGVLGWYDARNDDGVRHVYPSGYPHPDAKRGCTCGYQR